MAQLEARLEALRTSVGRLRALVEPLDDRALDRQAYTTEWTIAQVLSHVGSGAVIHRRRIDDTLNGNDVPDDFAPAVWDEWNAKTPRAQADDALAADAQFVARLEALTAEEQERFCYALGPMTVDLASFVGLRLNEHSLHTWDIEVALDDTATIPSDIAGLVAENLQLIAQFTGKSDGPPTSISVRTTDPERTFTLTLADDGVTLEPRESTTDLVLELPAESFVRLLYGRLDRDHTPTQILDDPTVDRLRRTFPGP